MAFMIRDDLRERTLAEHYDPVRGIGSTGPRQPVRVLGQTHYIPVAMTEDKEFDMRIQGLNKWKKLRCRHDFEYWCATCAYIHPKRGNKPVLCILNEGQRSVVAALEEDRREGRPVRAVILKARQWGCSTLIQLYLAWLQTCVSTGVNALICAHLKNASKRIRGMYSLLLACYPPELWEGTEFPALRNFEGSEDIKSIAGRDCTLMLSSCVNPDAIRGSDISLAHLTEVAYWRSSSSVSPEDVAQAIFGTVVYEPSTVVVLESTANGVGNYFHREWLRSKETGNKRAIFVPWNELSCNKRKPAGDAYEVFRSLDDNERKLFDSGMTLSQVYWRRCRRAEMDSDERFNAEFPLHDTDAFMANEFNVFDAFQIENLRANCNAGAERGGLAGTPPLFTPAANGRLAVWRHPEPGCAYVAAVDVGGRSASSDWSVIAVLSHPRGSDLPEVVAQWRGHIDHDLLADKAIEMARYFNNALLVVESNTLETDGSNAYVLEEMARKYRNMYIRRTFDTRSGRTTKHLGFHTNRSTKPMLIGNLIAAVRCGAYIEHDSEACNEMLNYRRNPDGSFGVESPLHDDILMTRAIGLFVIATEHPLLPPDFG